MKFKNIIFIIVLIGGLLLIKFIFFPSESSKSDNKQNSKKSAPANVVAYIVKSKKLSNNVYASGTLVANEEIQLLPETSGKIVQLNFEEGSKVTKGQLLVKINDIDLQANYKKLQLQLELANQKADRQKKLLAINGISQEEYDSSLNQYNILKADIENIAAQISKTEIRAPFTGVIGLKNVSEGAYVNQNTLIASVQQINPIKIDFSVAEQYASIIKKGNKITFTVEGIKQELTGKVYAIEPKIDPDTRTLAVRALSTNDKNEIYPGAFAKIKLSLSDIDSALMIPTEAIIPDLKGKKLYRIKNGVAESIKVVTGLRNDSYIQITEGLLEGDTIITRGIMQLKPGALVKIIELKN